MHSRGFRSSAINQWRTPEHLVSGRWYIRTSPQFLNKDSISIRSQQREALLHILSGRDMFVDLPTEFGKSLIFELTPLCFDCQGGIAFGSSKVLIMSPLITLMESQIRNPACFFSALKYTFHSLLIRRLKNTLEDEGLAGLSVGDRGRFPDGVNAPTHGCTQY